jgi:hypothetical protein
MGVLLLSFALMPLSAQPSWVKKAAKSVFTLKTFDANGALVGSTNGFFVGTNGEAMSNFTPFKGASRAVVIDASGKEYDVSAILGANDMYDVVKFRVAASKTQPLTVATTVSAVGSTAWLLPYLEAKTAKGGPVRKAETFQGDYAYYTVALQADENNVSCPLLNDEGEVIGLMQQLCRQCLLRRLAEDHGYEHQRSDTPPDQHQEGYPRRHTECGAHALYVRLID